MTCIMGYAIDGKVYIGADSASVSGWEVRKTNLHKVFIVDEFIVGYTTSFRMGQILQYYLCVRPQEENESDLEYMVKAFAENARNCLKDYGFSKIEHNVEEGGTFLVGYRGHLYSIYSDFQVNEGSEGFDACGSGREYALGAFLVTSDKSPEDRVLSALQTAAYFSGSVTEPYTILSI